ncbi:superoxide dismutase [Phytohalomonas tamaricis]|uniref:superoxide dismutase n=1 Tax=Phytohalomonas tamaricis TaxID=2081032 RepID=UPI000D0BBBB6|nr:Fe-Mn family superoxide dismutase [Phytohalomonas tamaricis]
MAFELPSLPYALDALEPYISAETMHHHHEYQHRNYLLRLNTINAGSPYASESLESLIMSATGERLACAVEAWNHSFFWHCLSPWSNGYSVDALGRAINERWGSIDAFKDAFEQSALALFSSGWTWLVKMQDGSLAIINTTASDTPLKQGLIPLLALDMWEHAYYLDYQGNRYKYIQAFWPLVNWEFAAQNLTS